ncbi:histidine biosynthesis HisG [Atractiella rhizophila]|nr:histidine biosynthesis HisG [Atractiella rhizophila]
MRAAGLKPIETILSSQAVLIRSAKPNSKNWQLMDLISSRIAGVIAAKKYVLCNYNILRSKISEATKITPGRRAATISPLDDSEWVAVSSMVERETMAKTMDDLQAIGASDVLILNISNCRV